MLRFHSRGIIWLFLLHKQSTNPVDGKMTDGARITNTDILISGAGVPGLALAVLLGRIGVDVTVIDPVPPPALADIKPDGRTAALMDGSLNILRQAGIAEQVESHGGRLENLQIIDSGVTTTFHARDIGLSAFGINIPNGVLQAALAEQASNIPTVRLDTTAGLESADFDAFGLTARLDNGTAYRARLLVGADGRRSPTRRIAGIAARTHDYGQMAITCLIDHTKPHEQTSTEFHRPSGPFTIVPMPGMRASIVWVDHTAPAEAFMRMDRHAFTQALQDRTVGLVGEVSLASAPAAWPLSSLRAKRLTAPRTALVAESAHVLHPLGAQGLNLSLRDIAVLAEILADGLRLGQDPGSQTLLDLYERRRRADIAGRVAGTDGLNRLVSNDLSLIRALRQTGLRTLDRIPPLKTMAMRQGLSPRIEDSRLMRGEAL